MNVEVEDLGLYLGRVAATLEAIVALALATENQALRYPCVVEAARPLLEGDEASNMVATLNAIHEAVTRRLLNLLREGAPRNEIGDSNA